MRPLVDIYTDGSCNPNPGPGGWGAILKGEFAGPLEICGGVKYSTNNRMELVAAIRALEQLKVPCTVRLHTDSQYVQSGITLWIQKWRANGWRNAAKKPISNRDLWERLWHLNGRHHITWIWVKGHSGDEWNEKADRLAAKGREEHATT